MKSSAISTIDVGALHRRVNVEGILELVITSFGLQILSGGGENHEEKGLPSLVLWAVQ